MIPALECKNYIPRVSIYLPILGGGSPGNNSPHHSYSHSAVEQSPRPLSIVMSALNLAKHAATLAVFIGVLYQLGLRDLIWNTAGVGRVVQPIEDFQEYTCRRIRHSKLEGCEDMWLDDKERLLYAACASSTGRVNWCPS